MIGDNPVKTATTRGNSGTAQTGRLCATDSSFRFNQMMCLWATAWAHKCCLPPHVFPHPCGQTHKYSARMTWAESSHTTTLTSQNAKFKVSIECSHSHNSKDYYKSIIPATVATECLFPGEKNDKLSSVLSRELRSNNGPKEKTQTLIIERPGVKQSHWYTLPCGFYIHNLYQHFRAQDHFQHIILS